MAVATYNVHQWMGADGVDDPRRTTAVVKELRCQVIGLQEAAFPLEEGEDFGKDGLATALGMYIVLGPTFFREDVHFGNVLLSVYPILKVRRLDITVHPREPRGALDCDLDVDGMLVRVIVTHLGLHYGERRFQVKRLAEVIDAEATSPVIVMGDFNEWLPARLSLRPLGSRFGYGTAPRTFPSRFPLLPLDRIWARPREILVNARAHNTPLAKNASDHLPLRAVLEIPEGYAQATEGSPDNKGLDER